VWLLTLLYIRDNCIILCHWVGLIGTSDLIAFSGGNDTSKAKYLLYSLILYAIETDSTQVPSGKDEKHPSSKVVYHILYMCNRYRRSRGSEKRVKSPTQVVYYIYYLRLVYFCEVQADWCITGHCGSAIYTIIYYIAGTMSIAACGYRLYESPYIKGSILSYCESKGIL